MSRLSFDLRVSFPGSGGVAGIATSAGSAGSAGFEGFELHARHDAALDGITALFGASGSGKSTLLRCIAGLEPAVRGSLALDGQVWLGPSRATPMPTHARGVGFVFQDARLFPHLNVRGNLRYADERSRQVSHPVSHQLSHQDSHQDSPTRIEFDDVVQAFDLAPLLERRTPNLSGGERQRVAIGRALLSRPRILLLDEPMSALDAARKAEILPYLERLPARFGIPALYVTHDIDEVARLATRMWILSEGKIIASGPIQEVLERADLQQVTGRFEAGVVLTTRVLRHDPVFCLTHLEHHGQRITVPRVGAEVGSLLRVRIRARDVALATRRPEGSSIRNVLAGTLTQIQSDATTPYAETWVDIGGARLRARVTREAIAELGLAEGAPVFALVKSIALG